MPAALQRSDALGSALDRRPRRAEVILIEGIAMSLDQFVPDLAPRRIARLVPARIRAPIGVDLALGGGAANPLIGNVGGGFRLGHHGKADDAVRADRYRCAIDEESECAGRSGIEPNEVLRLGPARQPELLFR